MNGKGVVHVGAHKGEEVPGYIQAGRTPILLFEPQVEVLGEGYENYAHQVVMVVPIALGDVDDKIPFTVAQDPEGRWDTLSASAYGGVLPEAAEKLGWLGWLRPYNTKVGLVPCRRFDSWATETGFDLALFDSLVIDVQGMELPVLKGFGELLDRFTYATVECSEVPIYDGGAPASEVCEYMASHGFRQLSVIKVHDDIYFVKEKA